MIWAVTEAREGKPAKRNPVDADPARPGKALEVPDGNLIFTGARLDGSWVIRYVGKGKGKFRSHFASCPNAGDHRKRNPKTPAPVGHLCHARGCEVSVDPKMLMCAPHWGLVPQRLQAQVWATYVAGQETRKDPSPEYLEAATAAIAAVAEREAR